MICLKWHCKAQLMRIISILAGIIMEKKEKGEHKKMDISKRNAVRIVSFTVAVVGVLAVRNIQLMSSEKRALRSVNYTYSRAMGDPVTQ